MPDFSAFILRLEKQCCQKAEKDGGGDAGGCGPKASEQRAEQPFAVHGLAHLYDIYRSIGFRVLRTSAATGLGVGELRDALRGKTSAFTGNSGVGKSSLLNALDASFGIATGAVSERLGRGKHTTRHVELYALGEDTFVADTPGFASFEVDMVDPISCENLQYAFREFRPYIGRCRFRDCAHLKEPGCAVLAAVAAGRIAPERHESYARLYALSAQVCDWEKKK